MTTENTGPWALLREMRGRMATYGDAYAMRRIDAALAAHEAEERVNSATPVVEWRADGFGRAAMVGNASLSVWSWKDGWAWSCERHGETTGVAKNEEAAKSYAIAAARRM